MKITKNNILFYFIMLVRLGVFILGLLLLIKGSTGSALMCLLTLALTLLPFLLRRIFKLFIPAGLELTIVLFSVAANICGEVLGLYLRLPLWDLALHVIWGFVGGAVGYGLILILNGRRGTSLIFAAVFCLCLSMATALLWEFFEYFVDSVFSMDMQKDCYIERLSSVLLNPSGANSAVKVDIKSVVINGSQWPGYIDIGLRDTMTDLLVNFLGGIIFFLCLIISKREGRLWSFLSQLIPSSLDRNCPNDIIK